jgi:preprotein translocase subunit SecE
MATSSRVATPPREARQSPVQFSQEAWAELRKVTWPSRETVLRLTLIVLVISTLIAIYIYAFDNVFTITITNGIVGSPTAAPPAAP